jgi:hypothetical protein
VEFRVTLTSANQRGLSGPFRAKHLFMLTQAKAWYLFSAVLCGPKGP